MRLHHFAEAEQFTADCKLQTLYPKRPVESKRGSRIIVITSFPLIS